MRTLRSKIMGNNRRCDQCKTQIRARSRRRPSDQVGQRGDYVPQRPRPRSWVHRYSRLRHLWPHCGSFSFGPACATTSEHGGRISRTKTLVCFRAIWFRRLTWQRFPNRLRRCIIVAGPGFGKSALLEAIRNRFARGRSGSRHHSGCPACGIASRRFVLPDRPYEQGVQRFHRLGELCERGQAVVLFDGLDEVRLASRHSVLESIQRFDARYERTAWTLTVRDPAVLAESAEARIFEIFAARRHRHRDVRERLEEAPSSHRWMGTNPQT